MWGSNPMGGAHGGYALHPTHIGGGGAQWGGWAGGDAGPSAGAGAGYQGGGGGGDRQGGRMGGYAKQQRPRRPLGEPTNNIMIRNLPYAFREADLQELAQPFGKVIRATVWIDPVTKRPKGFGLVQYSSVTEAQAAVDGLTGREVVGSRGNTLRLQAEYSYGKGDNRRPLAEGPSASEKVSLVKEIRGALVAKGQAEPFGLTSMPLDRLQAYLDFLGGPIRQPEAEAGSPKPEAQPDSPPAEPASQ
eukprot:Hpha_TRINITY_DN16093_c3_g11::TRINITY_DN16093_c3_g11_i1::g.117053::m.117053